MNHLVTAGVIAGLALARPVAAAPRNDLSFVTANMHDFEPAPDWSTRYSRLAQQIAGSGQAPDIISLNEVGGWQACPPLMGASAGDYDAFDTLIHELHLLTGVQYRIAFMVGAPGSFGGITRTRCYKFSGSAVLYNPARIANRTPADAIARPVVAHDASLLGLGMRRSLPVCTRGTSYEPIASLIDGPLTSEKCATPTPSGPAWTWYVQPSGMDGRIAAALGRFSFVSEPSSSFDVVTVHPIAGDEAAEAFPIDAFITGLSGPSFRTAVRTIPTIATGDYNSLVSNPTWLTGMTRVFAASVMAQSQGISPGGAPARYAMTLTASTILPSDDPTCAGNSPNGFSDHCGFRSDYNFAGATPPPLPPYTTALFDGTSTQLTSSTGDWAFGEWKGECDGRSAVTGLSALANGTGTANRVLCRAEPPSTFPHQACHVVKIDAGQNRGTTATGDWDPFFYKGECATDEYIAGVDQTTGGELDALLCCPGVVTHTSCTARVIGSNQRESTDSFDWDLGAFKAECGLGRYAAGLSRDTLHHKPHAILCCNEDGPEPIDPICPGGSHNPSCNL